MFDRDCSSLCRLLSEVESRLKGETVYVYGLTGFDCPLA